MEEQIYFAEELQELRLADGIQYPVVLFNGPVCTAEGLYRVSELDFEEARRLVCRWGFESAVGHVASAEVLSAVLGVPVPMNRVDYVQKAGQMAIALKLNKGRKKAASGSCRIYAVGFRCSCWSAWTEGEHCRPERMIILLIAGVAATSHIGDPVRLADAPPR